MMKKNFTRIISAFLAFVMVLTMGLAGSTVNVEAASKKDVYFASYNPKVITYSTKDNYKNYYTYLYITGCTKKSEIKDLKSSNKNIKVTAAKGGCIKVVFHDKAEKTKITCTVKGVKLSTTFTVKKYSNPCKSIKLGTTNMTSKFKDYWEYTQKKEVKNKTLDITMNKNWKILKAYVYSSNSGSKSYYPNSNKFKKKISLTGSYSYVNLYCYNSKDNCYEVLTLKKSNY